MASTKLMGPEPRPKGGLCKCCFLRIAAHGAQRSMWVSVYQGLNGRLFLSDTKLSQLRRMACVDGSCIARHFWSDLCICQKQSCVRPVCAVLTAGPDGFRKPSPLQEFGLLGPGHSTGCLGFGGRLMHHHLAGLAISLFLFLSSRVRVVRLVSGQNGPDDPSRFVGHCNSRYACWFSFQ